MSKFNFLAGGYYGKLGQTVGQRWKNKRNLRTYVIPANPKTPAQVENRFLFAGATKASQLAMQMNNGAGFWKNPDMTEWNVRMKSARQYYTDGMNMYQFLPAIPYGFIPAYIAETAIARSGQTLTFTVFAEDDISGRSMSVLVQAQNKETLELDDLLLTATVGGSGGTYTFSVTLPDTHTVTSDCYVIAVSRDDNADNTDTIYLYPQIALSAKEVVDVTVTQIQAAYNGAGACRLTFTFDTTLESGGTVSNVVVSGNYQKQAKEYDFSQSSDYVAGTTSATFVIPADNDSLGQHFRFGTNCTIDIGAVEIETDDKIYRIAALSGASVTDNTRTAKQNLVYSITQWGNYNGAFAAKTDIEIDDFLVAYGYCEYPYFDSGDETAQTASGKRITWNNTDKTLVFESSDVEKHYTSASREITVTTKLSVQHGGCAYQFNDDTYTQTNANTTHYTATDTVSLSSFTRNSANSYTVALAFATAKSCSFGTAITATAKGVLQGEWETQTLSVAIAPNASGVASFSFTPAQDSLSQYAQYPTGSEIAIPAIIGTMGMTDFSVSATTLAVSATVVSQSLVVPTATVTDSGVQLVLKGTATDKASTSFTALRPPFSLDDSEFITGRWLDYKVSNNVLTFLDSYDCKGNMTFYNGELKPTSDVSASMVANGVPYTLQLNGQTVSGLPIKAITLNTMDSVYRSVEVDDNTITMKIAAEMEDWNNITDWGSGVTPTISSLWIPDSDEIEQVTIPVSNIQSATLHFDTDGSTILVAILDIVLKNGVGYSVESDMNGYANFSTPYPQIDVTFNDEFTIGVNLDECNIE